MIPDIFHSNERSIHHMKSQKWIFVNIKVMTKKNAKKRYLIYFTRLIIELRHLVIHSIVRAKIIVIIKGIITQFHHNRLSKWLENDQKQYTLKYFNRKDPFSKQNKKRLGDAWPNFRCGSLQVTDPRMRWSEGRGR